MRWFWDNVKAGYVYYLAFGFFVAIAGLLSGDWVAQLMGMVFIVLGYFGSQHDESLTNDEEIKP